MSNTGEDPSQSDQLSRTGKPVPVKDVAGEKMAHLASFPELNPHPMLEIDSDGTIKYLNPAAKKLFPDLEACGARHPFLGDWEHLVAELRQEGWQKPHNCEVKVGDAYFMQTLCPVAGTGLVRIYSREITDRKRTEERLSQVNRTLRTIRNVNQLIALEKDRGRFLEAVCRVFTENHDYHSAWIALLDDSGQLAAAAESGVGETFTEMAWQMKLGSLPACARAVLEQTDAVLVPTGKTCSICPLSEHAHQHPVSCVRLEHSGRVFGVLACSVSHGMLDEEEKSLFTEVGQDIALALHDMELNEKHRQAEAALEQSEARYHDFYENAPVAYLSIDDTGHIIQANKAACLLLGYVPEELIGKHRLAIFAEESQNRARALFENFKRGELVQNEELTYQSKDGGKIYGLLSFNPIKDETGRVIASRSVIEDITELKRLQQDLAKERQDYKLIIDSSPIIIFYKDKEGRFVRVNKAFAEALAVPEEAIIGKTVFDLYSDKIAQAMTDDDREVFISERPKLNIMQQYESAKGLRWVQTAKVPILDKNSSVVGLVGFSQDITERKRAEAALRESEERFRSVSSITSDIAYSCQANQDGAYSLDWMTGAIEQITGYATDEIETQRCWRHLVIDEDLPLFDQHVTGLSPGQSASCELRLRHKNGEIVWVTSYAQCFAEPTASGRLRLYGGLVNITERKRAEAALRESEERYRNLIESTHEIVQSVGSDGKFIFVNQTWHDVLHYSEADLANLTVFDVIHPDSLAHCGRLFRDVLSGKPATHIEAKFKARDGAVIHVEGNATPRYLGGKAVATQGFFRDVTARKQMEEALNQAERNFHNSLDNSPLGIRIADSRGKTLYVNKALLDIYGYNSLAELNATPNRKRYTPESYAEHTLRRKRRQRGEPAPDGYEIGIMRKDGEVRYLEVLRKEVMWNGKPQTQVLYRDVTERKEMEDRLRQSELKYSSLVEKGNDGIVIIQDGLVKFANQQMTNIIGFSSAETLGKPFTDFMAPGDASLVSERYRKRMRGEPVPSKYEAKLLSRSGEEIPVEISASIIEYEGKAADMAIVRDITERRRMQEQLILTDRLASIGELAAGLAHEINNPLTGVIGFSQLLLRKDLPEDARESVTIIHREAQRTAEVVKNLLTFARKHSPLKQLVDISAIIEKVLELRAYEQRVNNIQVVTQLATNLPEIMADYFQLQQVFLNITINAEYFMIEAHSGGTLTISTVRDGRTIKVSFSDDGPGIAPQALGHIFDPFFTTKPVGKGTGLGLSICHGIVSEHGGKIHAESEPGKGATFIIELPVSSPSEP